jgi:hypothetical protein
LISEADFDNIEFDGIKFIDIQQTNGNEAEIRSLFSGSNVEVKRSTDPSYNYITFRITGEPGKGIRISFSERMSADDLGIDRIEITGPSSVVKVRGVTVRPGSGVSNLAPFKANTDTQGNGFILFATSPMSSNPLVVEYNKTSNIITRIFYFVVP